MDKIFNFNSSYYLSFQNGLPEISCGYGELDLSRQDRSCIIDHLSNFNEYKRTIQEVNEYLLEGYYYEQ